MVAILGGAVALGGLLLIFSGYLFAQAAILPPAATRNDILNRYRNAARGGLYPFAGALAVAAISSMYWFEPCSAVAHGVIIAFVVLVASTIFYGFWATRLL
jgi:ABC-type transport system involved in cytochrome bd biosynthesis fused ATPase/permease subunit